MQCPTGVRGEMRTYTTTDAMNGLSATGRGTTAGCGNQGGPNRVCGSRRRRTSTMPGPANRLVFLDEGRVTPDSYATHYVNATLVGPAARPPRRRHERLLRRWPQRLLEMGLQRDNRRREDGEPAAPVSSPSPTRPWPTCRRCRRPSGAGSATDRVLYSRNRPTDCLVATRSEESSLSPRNSRRILPAGRRLSGLKQRACRYRGNPSDLGHAVRIGRLSGAGQMRPESAVFPATDPGDCPREKSSRKKFKKVSGACRKR